MGDNHAPICPRTKVLWQQPGLIHHSDRGSQYVATEYQMTLKQHGILSSMSGKGNCYDNAVVEAFFKTLKAELVWRMKFESREQAERTIHQYIMNFYNRKRRHSTLGNISPMAYEKLAAFDFGPGNADIAHGIKRHVIAARQYAFLIGQMAFIKAFGFRAAKEIATTRTRLIGIA
tara:strand:+ start:768 stop:1292 length:525 start_codon:yes stop_codon:yes gene_type:complete